MVELIVLLFVAIALPLALMLFAVRGRTRTIFAFMLCGLCACLAAAFINTAFLRFLSVSKFYMTVNVTPIIEEILKLLPLIVYTMAFKPERRDLLDAGIACGIGFAMLENALIIARAASSVSLFTAVVRGIGAGMMHALCVCIVAFGISLMQKRRKWFLPGTAALVICAMTVHSLYNILIQSRFYLLGLLFNVVLYAVLLVTVRIRKTKN